MLWHEMEGKRYLVSSGDQAVLPKVGRRNGNKCFTAQMKPQDCLAEKEALVPTQKTGRLQKSLLNYYFDRYVT